MISPGTFDEKSSDWPLSIRTEWTIYKHSSFLRGHGRQTGEAEVDDITTQCQLPIAIFMLSFSISAQHCKLV